MLRYSFANEQAENQTENGFLLVEVLKPDESPISLATISLMNKISDVDNTYKVLRTGIDGKTESIELPVTRAKYSLTNLNIVLPYLIYSLSVEAVGFYTHILKVIPIYPHTTTILRIVLTPLPFGVKITKP